MKPLAPKTTLQNRYQITELIGKGGMGEVYLAIDQRLGHSVALKRTTVGDDILLAEAFEREARTLAQLRHNVLPKVSDHFLENDEQFLVMDYISGEDLSERLKATNKPFPLNWVMFWADQLLEALNYLHTHNPPIIHRDIKPQNLKLTGDNNVVLLDFGLSKNTIGTRVTTSGSVVGYTPHYAPMEQIRGTGTNAKSDIFSLSATLYHLFSNIIPPDALTRADVMLTGMPDPLKPLCEVNPEISPAISDAIHHGLEISQDKRFSTAREMQKALRKAFNDMQSSMSAETIAFNGGINEADLNIEVMNDVSMQTEEMPTPILANQSVLESPLGTPQQFSHDVDYSAEKTEIISSAEMQDVTDEAGLYDTVQFNGGLADVESEDLTGMQTEVIADEVSNEIELVDNFATQGEIPAEIGEFKTNDDFASADFKTSEDVAQPNIESADATVPLITMDHGMIDDSTAEDTTNWNEGFESEVISVDETADNQASSATAGFGLTDNFTTDNTENFVAEESVQHNFSATATNVEEVASVAAVQDEPMSAPPPKQKSSVGKYVAILGGLGVVLFLLLGTALGVGYYYTNGTFGLGGDSTTDTNQTETPKEEPKVDSNPEITTTDNTETSEPTNTDEGNSETTETTSTSEGNSGESTSGSTETTATKTDNQTSGKTTTPKTSTQNTKNTTAKTTTTTTTKQTGKTSTTTKKPPTDTTTKKPPVTPPTKKKKDAGVL